MWLDKLKQMKKISQKTSQQISEETGVPKSTIDKLFAGQTKEPYLQSTRLIVHAMGFTLDDLDDNSLAKNEHKDIGEERLISNYNSLNELGKTKLLEYSDDLVDTGKYVEPMQNEKHA